MSYTPYEEARYLEDLQMATRLWEIDMAYLRAKQNAQIMVAFLCREMAEQDAQEARRNQLLLLCK